MGEVNYYSSKIVSEKNLTSPKIIIPSISVEESINNVSLNQGILSDPGDSIPTKDPVVLYGHRTLQGSPFLRLNELNINDTILLEWPNVGELNFSVVNSSIHPETYNFIPKGDNALYLITCDPIGSTENRIIVESELIDKNPINMTILKNNPQEHNALIITIVFLVFGLILSYFYPKDHRIYVLIVIIILTAILIYFCINPIPSEIIYDKILFFGGF